jgi:hypothetical protein
MKKVCSVVLIQVLCFLNLVSFGQTSWYTHKAMKEPINLIYDEDEEQEDTIRGFSYGLNLGSYFGSSKTANFYNGTCPIDGYINEAAQVRCYTIEERLDPSVFITDGQYINNQIGSSGYTFPYDTYPTNMRYNPALFVGLQLKYNFSRYESIVLNINATKLTAAGQFTIQFIGTPAQPNAQSDVRLFSIAGSEQRANINLGYRQGWMMGDASNFYMQFGGSMLATKWTKNYIQVANRSFDLITSAPIAGQTANSAQAQAGVGFGGYGAAGFEFWAGKVSFDISFGLSRDKVVIFSYEKNVWNKWLGLTFTL